MGWPDENDSTPPRDGADGDGDGWPLADSRVAVDPLTERLVTAEIRAVAESRGEEAGTAGEVAEAEAAPTTPVAPAPPDEPLSAEELLDAWPFLDLEERSGGLRVLSREEAEETFIGLRAADQASLIAYFAPGERRQWMRLLEPDDAADVIQEAGEERRTGLLDLLDAPTRKEVQALLAYKEDEAGGLMNTRYSRLRPNMTVDEAISYLRRQAQGTVETIYISYVLDAEQRLLGVVSFRDLFAGKPAQTVSEIMETDVVRVNESMDQESVGRVFAEHDLTTIPVVDDQGRMKGIVTIDDIVDVVQEEATEDAQKFGGMEALELPYLEVRRRDMVRKRGGWLSILLVGEMLTATALGFFENEIGKAVVLALFIPLIISSGGNSGSQASTLIIRAMALGEVRAADWWRVMRREIGTGLALGGVLAVIAALRVSVWGAAGSYGQHWILLAITVAISLVFVVMFGTLAGSMLPFLLRRLGFDPASASAPFVATLVDVTGLVIYFLVASLVLSGSLL